MKKKSTPRTRAVAIAIIVAGVAAFVVTVNPFPGALGLASATTSIAKGTSPGAPVARQSRRGLIAADPSRSECLTPHEATGRYGLAYLQSLVNSFDSETHSSVTCLSTFLSGAPNWSAWERPWVEDPMYGYGPWVAQAPQSRQLVLEVDLIPDSLEDVNNPLSWEESCASGAFNSHASALGASLVAAGLQNSVLRLGAEMNGIWEADFIGTTNIEQKLWATCFANEVTALRQTPGEHFLIDWNVNACKGDYPYANFYPGNAYVDILGLDLYDVACETPYTRVTFHQLSDEQAGLKDFEAFADAQGKPMSLPEWGLSSIPAGDDPAYINGIGAMVARGNFAFETYFDAGGLGKNLPLTAKTPESLLAFRKWFGSKG